MALMRECAYIVKLPKLQILTTQFEGLRVRHFLNFASSGGILLILVLISVIKFLILG